MKKLKWWIKNDLKMWIFTLLMALGLMGQCQCIYRFINSDFKPNYKREMIYGFSIKKMSNWAMLMIIILLITGVIS